MVAYLVTHASRSDSQDCRHSKCTKTRYHKSNSTTVGIAQESEKQWKQNRTINSLAAYLVHMPQDLAVNIAATQKMYRDKTSQFKFYFSRYTSRNSEKHLEANQINKYCGRLSWYTCMIWQLRLPPLANVPRQNLKNQILLQSVIIKKMKEICRRNRAINIAVAYLGTHASRSGSYNCCHS